ncbi:FMN-dependent NADH-azoreductase [Mucilaginibacter sp. 14171R-50]|uniref:FMN-dependent NADH-azoreductase n=1 Tax=Mucilaginibacter sp. 14171R-50 TaxID=2703789 RepID=UPI00138DCB45|nr:NAD(P)H-dependent oxidoreductase [Mucilaginibacter sp. 14171R-50]QHS55002.1 FMN-dependent NADH-azoreductase [Mucilaginibacter sp. 14171R-50]
MKKILHIISSPRGEASMSIKLGNAITEKIKAEYPGSTVKVHNLATHRFPHLEEVHIASFFTPEEHRTHRDLEAIRHSEEAINEIKDADIIVIGVPIYNFNISSTLKAWLDHIVRRGVTFKYDENGPQGLLDSKKVYLALSSGGIFSEGPMTGLDFSVPYLRHMLAFIGLTDVTVYRVEGLSIPGIQDTALEKGINSVVIA